MACGPVRGARREVKAAKELQRRVNKLPPSQQRRYENVKVRDAPFILQLLSRRTGTVQRSAATPETWQAHESAGFVERRRRRVPLPAT
jgi:hypothetical protein